MVKRVTLLAVLLFQFHGWAAQSQVGRLSRLKIERPALHIPAIFPFSIRRDETSGCRSIASWIFSRLFRAKPSLILERGPAGSQSGRQSGWAMPGSVYAVDINPEAIRYIEARIRKEKLTNVKPVLGKPDDPTLPVKVDAVLLLKTYHEVAQPITLLRNLRPSLAAGARVGVIDRNGNGENHGVAREVVIREANEAGYRLLQQYDFVKDGMDYFLVFGEK